MVGREEEEEGRVVERARPYHNAESIKKFRVWLSLPIT
jgi:hypothetical protein